MNLACSFEGEWTRGRVLFLALTGRLFLVMYAHVHDYFFEVSFTDIDYSVYSDAARLVSEGGSPYDRLTYRYSPVLAWMLIPTVRFPSFGKILFCCCDVLVGWLCMQLADSRKHKKRGDDKDESDSVLAHCVVFWLAHPLTAIVSSRGNADTMVVAAVVLFLTAMHKKQWIVAAFIHGALAVHLKIYPIIFLPAIYLHFVTEEANIEATELLFPSEETAKRLSFFARLRLFFNWKGIVFTLISLGSFVVLFALFKIQYGDRFVHEYLLYHITRRDIRHNFSLYFYPLYLAEQHEQWSRALSLAAFVPQVFCIVLFAFRYARDLPFACFLTTFAFVAYNKVCTSQYFVWYLSFLPIIAGSIDMSIGRCFALNVAWLLAQAAWLLPAYLYEFRGYSHMFECMFGASVLFLAVNSKILVDVAHAYRPPRIASSVPIKSSKKTD